MELGSFNLSDNQPSRVSTSQICDFVGKGVSLTTLWVSPDAELTHSGKLCPFVWNPWKPSRQAHYWSRVWHPLRLTFLMGKSEGSFHGRPPKPVTFGNRAEDRLATFTR